MCTAATAPVTVSNRPPVASFTYSPETPETGDVVTFDASGSYDPDGTIISYVWDLDGDGQNDDGVGVEVTYTYSDSRAYMARVRVVDDDGAAHAVTAEVTVVDSVARITEYNVTVDYDSVNICWTNPSSKWAGTQIVRNSNNYPGGPDDGEVIYNGICSSFVDVQPPDGICYYGLFAYNSAEVFTAEPALVTVSVPNWHQKKRVTLQGISMVQTDRKTLNTRKSGFTPVVGKTENGTVYDLFIQKYRKTQILL